MQVHHSLKAPAALWSQTGIKQAGYLLAVHSLSDEHKLLHTVAIDIIPVTHHAWILLQELLQLVSRHRSIPLSGITQTDLSSRLLKDIAYILFSLKIAYTLSADNRFRPQACNEMVKL